MSPNACLAAGSMLPTKSCRFPQRIILINVEIVTLNCLCCWETLDSQSARWAKFKTEGANSMSSQRHNL